MFSYTKGACKDTHAHWIYMWVTDAILRSPLYFDSGWSAMFTLVTHKAIIDATSETMSCFQQDLADSEATYVYIGYFMIDLEQHKK